MTRVKKGGDYRDAEYVANMVKYLEKLNRVDEKDTKIVNKIQNELINFGIADSNGQIKKKIVSWE